MSDQEHILLLTMHHIISDGWSIGVLMNDVLNFYNAFSRAKPVVLDALQLQYVDFAHWPKKWVRSAEGRAQIAYWEEKLKGLPAQLLLPTDKARPKSLTYKGNTLAYTLPISLCDKLYALCRERNVTLFMVLMAAFNILLARLSGQNDIAVGSGVASRPKDEFENMIGFFADVWVLRTNLSGNPLFGELLAQVKNNTLEAYSNQAVPFDEIVNTLKPERNLSYTPIYQVMLILHNVPLRENLGGDLAVSALDRDSELYKKGFILNLSKHDLSINLWEEADGGITGLVEYYADIFEQDTIEKWLRNYTTLLSDIVAHPDKRIGELVMWTDAERNAMLETSKSANDEIDVNKLSTDDVDALLKQMLDK